MEAGTGTRRKRSNLLTFNEVSSYKAKGYERLHAELVEMFQQAESVMQQFNEDKKLKLLPALAAMQSLTAQPGQRVHDPNMPNWSDECGMLGITPEQVRQWKSRTASEADIREILGEEKRRRKKKKPDDEEKLRRALKAALRLAKLVVNQKVVEAHDVAKAILDQFGGDTLT